ncbi:glycosyltransferase involved in cell wall biosynthesis [Halanaerobium saccharolyticum]|uniref:Glycosyltransferase involved in cell wall biosynthesis n=1 Tax=Halanaerobium saccharolyticum TaxID=43595 RepID=A0A4R6R8N8_9FIRM|nr:glycosyltransferase family 4 protein [Halanaerobium saccharolyticum]TDP82302.1 glycosyltransferase involved in cell wall biosynthesis [Halanaerobium saccharolyticum]
MDKILHISPEPPSDYSGGGIVVKQSLLSLNDYFNIDYIGPEIYNNNIMNLINNKFFLEENNNKFKRIFDLLIKKETTAFYDSWIKNKDKIKWDNYDYVYLEFTKFNFVAKEVKKREKKLIVRLHNIEKDYVLNQLKTNFTINKLIKYFYIINKEKETIKLADFIIVLTNKDKKRLEKDYGDYIDAEKIGVLPVCIDKSKNLIRRTGKNNKITLLITGSLWYGPNFQGIKWFIENVWNEIKKYCNLIIAGSKPTDYLEKLVSQNIGITLIKNPDSMDEYFNNADLYIAPIFKGAGMKVKIAEALAHGLPVIGTNHAFIGYDIKNEECGFLANSSQEFKLQIKKYFDFDEDRKIKLVNNAIYIYENNYSINKSKEFIRNIFQKNIIENSMRL